LIESVKLREPGRQDSRIINLFGRPNGLVTGWYTLDALKQEYGNFRTDAMCFVWNRILEGLTLAHAAGVVHGAVTPNHVLIHADEHLGNIVDWTASCRWKEGQQVPYIDDRFIEYFPDEVSGQKGVPVPASDIYMSAWCMIYLLGGNPREKEIPVGVEKPMRDFLNRCVQPKVTYRPKTVSDAYMELRAISKQLFGKRRFVKLEKVAV